MAKKTTGQSRAEVWLQCLVKYLKQLRAVPSTFKATLRYDDYDITLHERDPRHFCSVKKGEKVIRCAGALNCLPSENIVGVLLHEIGHLHLQEFGGQESEVRVDAWATSVPASGFKYAHTVKYAEVDFEKRVVNNLESVDSDFVDDVWNSR